MPRNDSEESSDEETNDTVKGNRATKNLPCPSCDATGFTSVSKLNKHRNGHDKPYECLAEGCSKRFAQRQALDRHTQSQHSDANNPTKYYHCTVDGCKYSSTGRRRKRFVRVDQVKEHIKDYGHYGPHSANDRLRRRADWKPLFEEHIITARFEEWILDDASPRRTVQKCEYNSLDTKLWHKDVIGELFMDDLLPTEDFSGHDCPVSGCYYHQMRPPENCEITLFKKMKGLQEHRRRAHEAASLAFQSQLPQDEERESVSSSDSMGCSNYSWGRKPLNSNAQTDQHWPPDLDLSFGTHNFEGVQCFNPGCVQYRKALPGDLQPEMGLSNDFYLANQGTGWCQSCFQREPTTLEQPGHTLSLQLPGLSSGFQFTSMLSSSSTYATTAFPNLDISKDNMQNTSSTTNNNISSMPGEDSLKLRKLTCTFPGCLKTFRRNYELQRHMMSVHSPATIYCTLCRRLFRRKDKLIEHIRHVHSVALESDSTKAKAMFSDLSILSDPDWLSSSTFPSGKDAAPTDSMVPLGTEYSMEGVVAPMDLQPYSLSSEQWNSCPEEWQYTTANSLHLHVDTSESPICIDESGPQSFSMNQDMCNILGSQ